MKKLPIIELKNAALFYRPHLQLFSKSYERIWALKDITFTVYPGEKIGIIGKNGCGKSTLMKVLARIISLDKGKIWFKKKMNVQLLSLGVGLEGTLTGRENAILSGMFLGKSRRYMLERMEEIKSFSELGKFFDYPVSMYSAGMVLRLSTK